MSIVILAGGALALAACSGGGSADEGPTTLEELFESQFSSDRFAEQQEAVRACMVEQGFEYTPIDMREGNFRRVDADFNDEEWVKENGFGVTTGFGGLQDAPPDEIEGGSDDPNAAYRESLTDEQREAYDLALYGQSQDIPGQDAGPGVVIRREVNGGEGGGCFGQAIEEAGGVFADDAIGEALRELKGQIANDERVIGANRDWAACMAEDGFTYDSRDDAVQDISARLNEILGVEEPTGGDEESVIIIRPGDDPNATFDQAALESLRQDEIRIATASFECAKDTIAKVLPEVREEYEQQFIEDHPELTAE